MASETPSSGNRDAKNINRQESMSFMGHLEELRRRLLRSLLVLTIMILATYAFRKDILDLVKKPVEEPLQKYTSGLHINPSDTKKPIPSLNSLNCVCQPETIANIQNTDENKATTPGDEESKIKEVKVSAPDENIIKKWLGIAQNAVNDFIIFFKSVMGDGATIVNENADYGNAGTSEEIVVSDSGVINLSCACKAKSSLKKTSGAQSSMVYIGLPELFFAQMKVAIFAAIFLAFPYFLIEIWGFVGPALYKGEKKVFWLFAIFSYFFFIGGALFGYFVVFPFGFDFFLSLTQVGEIMPSLSIGEFLSLSIKLLLAFGFIFELPLITFILSRLGVVTPEIMIKHSRIAILIIFIASAMLTPPDPFTMVLMSGPLIFLYIISIGVCYFGVNRKKAALRAQGMEDDDFEVD